MLSFAGGKAGFRVTRVGGWGGFGKWILFVAERGRNEGARERQPEQAGRHVVRTGAAKVRRAAAAE